MQQYSDNVIGRNGSVIEGATVTVRDADGNIATLYSDDGVTAQSNPMTTDAAGEFAFYAGDGTYTISVTGRRVGSGNSKIVTLISEASVASYAALRAFAGTSKTVNVTGYLASANPSGIAGIFTRDDSDTTSADNGGTIIVASNGKRWKRVFSGPVDVRWFGAIGNGSTDDSPALVAALAAYPGGNILFSDPPVEWKLTQAHTIPENTTLIGLSKQSTKVVKAFNGDLFTLGTGAALERLYIDGQGATYTGKGVKMLGTTSKQRIDHCRIIEMDDNCIYFEKDAGSQFSSLDLEAYRRNAGTGTGRYAVAVEDALASGAVPRKFFGFESGGTCSFSFGGASNFYISDSFLGDLAYSSNSRAVFIVGSRQANQAALTLRGNNHTIVGGDINPQVTLAINTDNCVIGPNSYNTLPIIDNSGNARNLLYSWNESYTPVLGSGGVAPSLGDGGLTGNFSRNGAETRLTINLTIGTTTSLGTGGLTFTLPQQRWSTDIAVGGTVIINDASSGLLYTGVCQIAGNALTLSILRDTTGSITFNSPITFATGDTIRLDMTYSN
jgi:hypothetical protein